MLAEEALVQHLCHLCHLCHQSLTLSWATGVVGLNNMKANDYVNVVLQVCELLASFHFVTTHFVTTGELHSLKLDYLRARGCVADSLSGATI